MMSTRAATARRWAISVTKDRKRKMTRSARMEEKATRVDLRRRPFLYVTRDTLVVVSIAAAAASIRNAQIPRLPGYGTLILELLNLGYRQKNSVDS